MSRALLFSDMEGSTKLLQRLGSEYGAVLADHHRLMRHVFAEHGGSEQGTEGDSFFVLFDSATAAVGAAFAAQKALSRHAWPEGVDVRVRMGLHVGDVAAVGDTLVGLAIHEAARIMSCAHGGQLVASAAAATLADPLPTDASWLDLGEHRLKDIPSAMRLMQLTHPDLPAEFPPLRAHRTTSSTLPVPSSPIVGRVDELRELVQLVGKHRLLTLTGAGGSGKTRLGLAVGAELEDSFVDGVWFAELAQVTDLHGVLLAISEAAGMPTQSTGASLATMIGSAEALLIVDNCEHVVEESADVIDVLLRRCPQLRVITTSREPIGLDGEVSWRVPSLAGEDAVALFIARAAAAAPRLEFDERKRETATTICERLDGIPLAIELAAARLGSLDIDQVADRIDQRFRFLTGGRRGGIARQRTLQATVDWSYDLLDDTAKRLLRWLGSFNGSFSLEAAEAVGAAAGLDEMDVLDQLDALVQKSLVLHEDESGSSRFRLLETIRQYAVDRLIDESELVGARDAQLAWVNDWCGGEGRRVWTAVAPDDIYDRADLEVENFRTALGWALERADARAASIGAIATFQWFARGMPVEGYQWSRAILDTGAGTIGERLAVATAHYLCASNGGGSVVDGFLTEMESLAWGVPDDDPWAIVAPFALGFLMTEPSSRTPDERLQIAKEQLERARAHDNPLSVGGLHQAIAMILFDMGDVETARDVIVEMIDYTRKKGLLLGLSRSYSSLFELELSVGNTDAAWSAATEGLKWARRTKDGALTASFLFDLGRLAMHCGDLEAGLPLALEAVPLARRFLGPGFTAMCETYCAWIRILGGDPEGALAYAEEAAGRIRTAGAHRFLSNILHTAGEAARLTGRTEIAIERHLECLDAAVDTENGEAVPSALLALAQIAVDSGDLKGAAHLMGTLAADLGLDWLAPADLAFHRNLEASVRYALADGGVDAVPAGEPPTPQAARDAARSVFR